MLLKYVYNNPKLENMLNIFVNSWILTNSAVRYFNYTGNKLTTIEINFLNKSYLNK